jgi:hypothetical protein
MCPLSPPEGDRTMRKSTIFLTYIALNFALLIAMFLHAGREREAALPLLEQKGDMVRRLEITDLCLFTDARYTRHPSMADLHTPFQDYPLSFEHFPSGSLVVPPEHIKKSLSANESVGVSE